jgi:hypothetical protein
MSWPKLKAKTYPAPASLLPDSIVFGFQFWQLADVGNFGDLHRAPTRHFFNFIANKALPLFDPCVTLA